MQSLTGGQAEISVNGATVRQIIEHLDARFPGLGDRLASEGRLRPNISVAVDGEISPLGMLESLTPESEVHFITALKGGRS